MEDIRLGIALIVFVSIAMFCLTYRLLRDRSKIFMDFIAIVVVVLIVVYVQTVWGQLWIVKWIPLPSVIVLSNWFPPLLSTLVLVAAGFAQATWVVALACALITGGAVVAAQEMIFPRRQPRGGRDR